MAADEETPDVPGHVEPDPGVEEAPESEIPVGVDALTDEQIAQAEEAGPADAGGGDEEGGGDDALDVAALMEDGGGDDAGDAGDDADAADDADAGEPTPDDDTEGPDAASEEA